MRILTYTNPNGVSIELGTTAYPITSLTGLGIAGLENQTQKAPYQDGSTYIDTLLTDREISVQGAINKPKNLTLLNAAKDTMLRALNPKLGQGTLVYTYDGGTKEIDCIPNITFANKDGKNPFIDYEITFICNDPFFKSVAETTVSLSKPSVLFTNDIDSTLVQANSPFAKKNSINDNIDFVCLDNTGNLQYLYTDDIGVTLSAPEQITSLGSPIVATEPRFFRSPKYINTSGFLNPLINDYFLAVSKVLDFTGPTTAKLYVYFKDNTIGSGGVWGISAQHTISVNSTLHDVAQLLDGTNLALYSQPIGDGSDGLKIIKNIEFAGAITPIVITSGATNEAFFVQLSNGKIIVIYKKGSTTIYSKSSTDSGLTWIAESTVATVEVNEYIKMFVIDTFGNLRISTIKGDIYSYNNGLTWFNVTSLKYDQEITLSAFLYINDYTVFNYWNTNGIINIKIRTLNMSNSNLGHVSCPLKLIINGPANNPSVFNHTTSEQLNFNVVLNEGDYLEINTAFGNKKITKYISGVLSNGIVNLQELSTFFNMDIGSNIVYFEDNIRLNQTSATATMTWQERYLGV